MQLWHKQECTAAVDAAKAICSLARCGSICFDLDGNLIEDYRRNKTKKRHRMSEEFEGRWRDCEKRRFLDSHAPDHHLWLVDISDSGSVEEMSQKHYRLGAKPKWSAHADWPDLSEDSSTTPNPPWRDKSLWRITTTKTVKGQLSDQAQPNQGVKQKFQSMYEALSGNHAMHGVCEDAQRF